MHVYRWDLDRTYLDTAIDSVRGLLRTAIESATDKRTLPGAGALLRGLQRTDPAAQVCILSGSPTQLRAVLEEKLALDGIRFDKLLLKDNLGNLRRGRLRAVRGQVGYKLPALLLERTAHSATDRETLFGDDSEADALIYVAYAEALAGRLSADDLSRVLLAGRAYDDHVAVAREALGRVHRGDAVDDIFIRLDRRSPTHRFRCLGPRVSPVHSWLQAAVRLHQRGRLDEQGVASVVEAEVRSGQTATSVAGLLQDAVRRGLVDRPRLESLLAHPTLEPARAETLQALRWMGTAADTAALPDHPDYDAFLRQISHSG